ncbi:C2H2 zinc finger transcription factor PnCon7-like protein [Parastagonospora nodorum]|uniref:C2H2 zinc finger transcription factor PnCon7 isoform B n=1 Tax=Phaeosphaeria nodorum (strain SN15 / ATCC MYA-4574 / FGSC 10173) TaxID=321614 RepID=A0A7U2EX57_PHANO|nr:C2H2 zinc finger transcription factor PnCon7-like protein [Parastagonospora nodorum]QRC92584.1 C2H2 zinc finger transcription factor PnCon7 isoform B [Parastagonospora nodorum SN15]KAH3932857.1 C2H2 zinc finger transcription factor PnCon7-like protein [Parastagonospora nodorum]KAH3946175.1 C2H2 zinc finger transcription factor PnCon7-like protein [Parastagonospora nodorum]KAH3972948.1 C2H2 zinc finger transcription factor PnCon7-like protein [Parastagonospora nodorum]
MDARQQEYPQSDQASAAQYPSQGQDPRASNLTPTSDYSLNPSSARSGSFPDYIQRSYQPGAQGQAPGGMAQQQNPSIAAATSPTYSHQQQYSPYTPHHDMQHYPGHPQTPIYPSRPEWAGQYPQPGMHYGHPASSGPPAPAMVSPVQRPPTGGHPLSTVYSFVPIPGAQQHKRPRRRYEEIERMYKCGWNGCEKAYGTLNHLNAHVTMQSHGQKRTPEEFKEIRKEWKAKKKEEEAQRKADDERHRADAQQRHEGPPGEAPVYGQMRQAVGVPGQGPQHAQLPPIGYQPAASGNNAPPQYGTQSPGLPEGMAHYPQSPYGQNPQMYQQGH